jgi:hypothetical protein
MLLFLGWISLMIIYALIAIYNFNKKQNNLDILPIFIYNGLGYWKEDEKVYRCKIINGQIDLKNNEYVDPINLYDIDQIDYLLITQELEEMNQ